MLVIHLTRWAEDRRRSDAGEPPPIGKCGSVG
jgi:hypothetical protein